MAGGGRPRPRHGRARLLQPRSPHSHLGRCALARRLRHPVCRGDGPGRRARRGAPHSGGDRPARGGCGDSRPWGPLRRIRRRARARLRAPPRLRGRRRAHGTQRDPRLHHLQAARGAQHGARRAAAASRRDPAVPHRQHALPRPRRRCARSLAGEGARARRCGAARARHAGREPRRAMRVPGRLFVACDRQCAAGPMDASSSRAGSCSPA